MRISGPDVEASERIPSCRPARIAREARAATARADSTCRAASTRQCWRAAARREDHGTRMMAEIGMTFSDPPRTRDRRQRLEKRADDKVDLFTRSSAPPSQSPLGPRDADRVERVDRDGRGARHIMADAEQPGTSAIVSTYIE